MPSERRTDGSGPPSAKSPTTVARSQVPATRKDFLAPAPAQPVEAHYRSICQRARRRPAVSSEALAARQAPRHPQDPQPHELFLTETIAAAGHHLHHKQS